jgi:hypothetical protein
LEDTKNKFYSSVAPDQKAGVRYVDKMRENVENLKVDLKVMKQNLDNPFDVVILAGKPSNIWTLC